MLMGYADKHTKSRLPSGRIPGIPACDFSAGPETESMKASVLGLIGLIAFASFLPAQETSDSPAASAETALPPDQQVIEMDLKTSTLAELADWCRSQGLSEGGTKEELANRLREWYHLPQPDGSPSAGKPRLITIESAKTTEYFTLSAVNEEYARLRGGVIISLKDGEEVHRIEAEEILYNRTRNVMTASGGVKYEKRNGDTVETFKGESITVNLDTWSSLFLDGLSERSLSDDDTVYRFEGNIISRSDEDVTVLSNARITNAKTEEAYWSITASKLWLLPGSDWAVLNAVLKVGEIPLMYFPFFYFAADEPIFHPVIGPTIGHNSRTGNFLQTTTYLWGRAQASPQENSLSKIMGNGEDTEKVREGIFLRSTGKKYTGANDKRLSVLFDVYSNLGVYLGSQLALPKYGILNPLEASGGIGFTRDVYQIGSGYSPFAQYTGTDNWNRARLFGLDVPFRYRFTTQSAISGNAGTLSWALPFYSDPYTDRDFLNRSEEMDWIKLFKRDEPLSTAPENILGDYQWQITLSLNPAAPFLNPYITAFSLSNVSSVNFRSRTSAQITSSVSPTRIFFFPEKFIIYSLTASAGGTPFTWGRPPEIKPNPEEPEEDPFKGLGTLKSPWESPEEEKPESSAKGGEELTLPELRQTFTSRVLDLPQFTISYQLSPAGATELRFRSSPQNWPEAQDINWSEVSSLLTMFRGEGNIFFEGKNQLYSVGTRFSGSGQWQGFSYINPEAEEYTSNGALDQQKLDSANESNYRATLFSTAYTLNAGLTPLYYSEIWRESALQYTLGGNIAKSAFDGTGAEPTWKIDWGAWNEEQITAHQLAANGAASLWDYTQNVTVNLDLPPRDSVLSWSATARMWITETGARQRIVEPWEPDPTFEPILFTETIRFGNPVFTFNQTLTYDPELSEFTNAKSSLSWNGLTASFTAARSKRYRLNSSGWMPSEEPEKLNPINASAEYYGKIPETFFLKDRLGLSFNVRTKIDFDLQRYTQSLFTFELGFSVDITRFLTVRFSAASENKVIFRYFQNFFDMPIELPGEQNIFIDLANSFRFDDEALRRSSGFKLKSFNVALTHHLIDWDADLSVSLKPYLDETSRPYKWRFNPEITFAVHWIPISELKTEIAKDKDKLVIK